MILDEKCWFDLLGKLSSREAGTDLKHSRDRKLETHLDIRDARSNKDNQAIDERRLNLNESSRTGKVMREQRRKRTRCVLL